MADRDAVAEPRGARTPYGSGGQWPVRVDSHLADGLTDADVDRWVPTAAAPTTGSATADVIALFGHNVAETQSVLWTRMLDRLAGPHPPELLCVDPRTTEVAKAATVHSRRCRAPTWRS